MYFAAYWILFGVVTSAQSQTENLENRNKSSYENAQVWRVELETGADIALMKQLMDTEEVSMWKLTPKQADFLIYGDQKMNVYRLLKTYNLNHTVLVMDVQRRLDTQVPIQEAKDQDGLRKGQKMNWSAYPSYEALDEYLIYFKKNYPSICKLETIGYTSENRSIKASLCFGRHDKQMVLADVARCQSLNLVGGITKMMLISNGNPENKGLLITAGSHAREWISITSVLYIMKEIITKFDLQEKYIMNKNWYMIPLLNPDGYVYSQRRDRFWRKNRRKFKKCHGVDINRNFLTDWNVLGISENNECKGSYGGPSPFSEPESIALRDTVLRLKHKISGLVDFHSYGQLILYPWSTKAKPTPHAEVHNKTAWKMAKAINKMTNLNFVFGPTYHNIYPATGALIDWVYETGVRHTYAIECRDTGYEGFLLPPTSIKVAGSEAYAAVKEVAQDVMSQTNRGQEETPWL